MGTSLEAECAALPGWLPHACTTHLHTCSPIPGLSPHRFPVWSGGGGMARLQWTDDLCTEALKGHGSEKNISLYCFFHLFRSLCGFLRVDDWTYVKVPKDGGLPLYMSGFPRVGGWPHTVKTVRPVTPLSFGRPVSPSRKPANPHMSFWLAVTMDTVRFLPPPPTLKRNFVRIKQYCGFQSYVRVFLEGDVSLSLYDD